MNANNNIGFVLDVTNQILYEIKDNENLWNGSISIEAYLKSLGSLSGVLQDAKKENNKIDINNIPSDILSELNSIRLQLGVSPDYSIVDKIRSITINIALLHEPLGSSFKKNLNIVINGGLIWFTNVIIGISGVVNGLDGGLNSNTSLDYGRLLNEPNGIAILTELLLEISQHQDIGSLGLKAISDVSGLLRILVALTGGRTEGVDGLINIAYQIDLLVNGHGSLDNLITSLIQAIQPTRIAQEVQEFQQTLQELLKLVTQLSQKGNSDGLQRLRQIIQQIAGGSWSSNGINISAIIKQLTQGNGGLEIIIRVLQSLGPNIVGSDHGINGLIQVIIKSLNGTYGQQILNNLIPGINLGSLNPANILQSIEKAGNLSSLFSRGIDGISKIPVIGQIVNQIQSSFNGSLNLGNILNITGIENAFKNPLNIINQFGQGIENGIGSILNITRKINLIKL